MSTATIASAGITPHRPGRSDPELARAAGRGDAGAFEALYDRHHGPLLSFCSHMLGRLHDAEDVVQQTFLAADVAFRSGQVPASVGAWLYTVARNRCVSVIRARRHDRRLPDAVGPVAPELTGVVEDREQLRELLADLRTLPDDQRAALLLAELGDLSHAEVGKVIGVRTAKVKALVFQARETLMAAADARAIPCRAIQEELAVATGASRRRRHLREHVARCDGCRAYAAGVARQRAALAAILPVVPSSALRESVLAGLGGASAAGGGAGAGAGLMAVKSTAAKVLAIAALGGTAAGGGTVAVVSLHPVQRERPAAVPGERAHAALRPGGAAPATTPAPATERSDSRPVISHPAARAHRRIPRAHRRHGGAARHAVAAPAARRPEQAAGTATPVAKSRASHGLALGHVKQRARGKTPPGRAAGPKPAAAAPAPKPKHQAKPHPASPAHTGARKPPKTVKTPKTPHVDTGPPAAGAVEKVKR